MIEDPPAPVRAADRRALLGALALAAVLGLAWATGALDALSWASFRARRAALAEAVAARPLASLVAYTALYVVVAASSLPVASPLTLVGGALFGFGPGLVAVSLGSTVGATLSTLLARRVFADAVRRRFPGAVATMDRGLEEEGLSWLLAVRLVPALPFFVVNLALGLTRVPIGTVLWTSLLGMLPGTAVFVWAGTRFGEVQEPADLLSPGIGIALALLGAFPLVTRRVLGWRRASAPRAEDP